MRDRYTSLPATAVVFRLVKRGGGHFPKGAVLPLREWLEPTAGDKDEALLSGRPCGLSMWDAEITPEREAWSERGVDPAGPEHAAFYANVGRLRATGSLHDRTIDVVADPLQPAIPLWRTGHSLAEGIGRPSGTAKQAHRDLLDDLVQLFAT